MKAMAKNIVAGFEITVEVEVIAVYSETAYEVFVPSQGGKTIVQKKDLTFENVEDQKALELVYVIKKEFGIDTECDGNAGEDLQVYFTNEKKEIITILVNSNNYEVDTIKTTVFGSGTYYYEEEEKSKNVRKIVKLKTLTKWLEKRIG